MTIALSLTQIDAMRAAERTWGAPAKGQCVFAPVGTGPCWVDTDFGIGANIYDLARLLRERAAARVNEYAAVAEGRRIAETEPLENLAPRVKDSDIEEFHPRRISKAKAKKEILAYLGDNPGTDAFEIALALGIEPSLTMDICDKLFSMPCSGSRSRK